MSIIPLRAKSTHAQLAPFQRLPSEILIHLLSCTKSSLSLVPLTLICRTLYKCPHNESSLWIWILIDLSGLKTHVVNDNFANFDRKVTLAFEYSQYKPLSLTIDLLRRVGDSELDEGSTTPLLDNDLLSKYITHLLRITLPLCRELTIKCSLWLDMEILTNLIEGCIKRDENAFLTLEFFHMSYNPPTQSKPSLLHTLFPSGVPTESPLSS
ncbi:hypothetical protein PM082_018407 [Marasmius tenuissimus]|nr:hypothetical protein PM082_018407 [Marasmius tenuissimus]